MIFHRGHIIVFPHLPEDDFFNNYAHADEFRALLQERCAPGQCVYFAYPALTGPRGYPDPHFSGVFSSLKDAKNAIDERLKNFRDDSIQWDNAIFQDLLNS